MIEENKIIDTCWLLVSYFLGLLFRPEDGGNMFLENVSKLLPDYTASQKRNMVLFIFPVEMTSNRIKEAKK
jgi:hypothetical protein